MHLAIRKCPVQPFASVCTTYYGTVSGCMTQYVLFSSVTIASYVAWDAHWRRYRSILDVTSVVQVKATSLTCCLLFKPCSEDKIYTFLLYSCITDTIMLLITDTAMLCTHFINYLSSTPVIEVMVFPRSEREKLRCTRAEVWSIFKYAIFQSLMLCRALLMLKESFPLMIAVTGWHWSNQKHTISGNLQKLDLCSAFSSICKLLWHKGLKKKYQFFRHHSFALNISSSFLLSQPSALYINTRVLTNEAGILLPHYTALIHPQGIVHLYIGRRRDRDWGESKSR